MLTAINFIELVFVKPSLLLLAVSLRDVGDQFPVLVARYIFSLFVPTPTPCSDIYLINHTR